MEKPPNSYAQILKSSSIMAGAAGINVVSSLIRTKCAALVVGTAGVGMISSFSAIQVMVAAFMGFGIHSSSVREISISAGKGNAADLGRTVLALRRVCWVTGLAGMLAMFVASPILSAKTFGTSDYTLEVATLGIVVLITSISGAEMAVIQGTRRIADLARANVLGAAIATAASICLYIWLGMSGIVPAIAVGAVIQMLVSFHFARQINVPKVELGVKDTIYRAVGMVRLGVVFMGSGFVGSAVGYGCNVLITQHCGLHSLGLYNAALAVSSVFVNFVLSAMSADYYPSLTSISSDRPAMCKLVNEQTEIAILLVLPGIVGVISFKEILVQLFYSSEFSAAVKLLDLLAFGCLARVVSWPMGFVILALGRGALFFVVEVFILGGQIALLLLLIPKIGILAAPAAFAAVNVCNVLVTYITAKKLIGFAWGEQCKKILVISVAVAVAQVITASAAPRWASFCIGVVLLIAVGRSCVRKLVLRAGVGNRISRKLLRLPGAKVFFGIRQ